jgi:hypothetical protein
MMGLDAMIYIPSFIKSGLAIQKLIVGVHRHADKHVHKRHGNGISILSFFKIRIIG